MEMSSCSVRVKMLTKVGLSDGRGAQLDFPLKGGGLSRMLLQKKYFASMLVSNLFQNLYISCLKNLVRVGTKDKPLVRTENSYSVNVWLGRFCIMFLLYWEVCISMDLVVNFRNEDLHWFCGKRTFIDGVVCMSFSVLVRV